MTKKALYLAGGGARGAYQAGVLKALSTILGGGKVPFEVISGTSVGSLNAAILAENAQDFIFGTDKLVDIWNNIHSEQIFNASNYEVSKSVLRNVANVFARQQHSGYLLDATPLRSFISQTIDFDSVAQNIREKHIEALEVISNCYETDKTVSFYQHSSDTFEDWNYPRHISMRGDIKPEHVLASSALPLFFSAVKIDNLHYGDGSMGLISPLRGAIRFQVSKILILGTRPEAARTDDQKAGNGEIGFAQILGEMMNGVFLDHLDRDIEMVNRMNDLANLLSLWKKRRSPWRPIQTLHLKPAANVAVMAQRHYSSMPALMRFMLNSMGAKKQTGELLSFLLFEAPYTRELVKAGYKDTMAHHVDVELFFS